MGSGEYTSSFLQNLSEDELRDVKSAELADQISTYFTPNKTLSYAGVAGLGSHGGALLFRKWNEEGGPYRDIIVKYSLDERADDDLRNESRCLEYLRGAEHIVQLISLPETQLNVSGTGRRPTIALEFMPHGDGHRFREKLAAIGCRVTPSRILWRFFLCLARQRVAMAYPPLGEPGAPVSRERIRYGEKDFGLIQNSPHTGNIVFGDFSNGTEHGRTPLAKLIDFGRGEVSSRTDDFPYFMNIFGAGHTMTCLALPMHDLADLRVHAQSPRNKYVLLSGHTIETLTPLVLLETQNIDRQLRDLIALCNSPLHFRPLVDVLERCTHAVSHRRLEHFVNASFSQLDRQRETDEGIYNLMRYVFLDADVTDPPRELSRPTINLQMGTTLLGLFESQYAQWGPYMQWATTARSEQPDPNLTQTLWEEFNEDLKRRKESMQNTHKSDVE